MSNVLYCHCSNAGVLPFGIRDNVLKRLCESEASFIASSDLCGQSVRPNRIMKSFFYSRKCAVLACYPRVIKSLFSFLKTPLSSSALIGNMRRQSLRELLDLISQIECGSSEDCSNISTADGQATPCNSAVVKLKIKRSDKFEIVRFLLERGFSVHVLTHEGDCCVIAVENENWSGYLADRDHVNFDEIIKIEAIGSLQSLVFTLFKKDESAKWYPWYPIIDTERCSQCLQCVSFCLFGVYDIDDDGKLAVVNPEKCKTNCPACARVCPDTAIMFPKYSSEPINGGEISDAANAGAGQKVDIQSLIQGDLYEKLKERNKGGKTRFAPSQSTENKQLAERERQFYVQKFAADIPPDVLSSLPSMDELKKLADEAARRAKNAADLKDREKK